MRRFLQPSLSIIMFGGLLLLATTLGAYYCVPIRSGDEVTDEVTGVMNPKKDPGLEKDAPQSANHFCERMYAGQYSDIRLQSFSPRRSHIRMYESGNQYRIPGATMDKHKVQLPEQYSKFSLNKTLGGYKPDNLRLEDVLAIYDIRLGDADAWWMKYYAYSKVIPFLTDSQSWPNLRRPLILFTSTREYIWNLVFPWFWWSSQGEIMSTNVRASPDYALVYRLAKSEIAGYVINQDIYGPSSDFIIYDLSLPWETLLPNVQFRDATHEQKESAPYYYVQKTDNPSEVLLVHRSNYKKMDDDLDRALFHSLPHGFVHQFNTDFRTFIYLFDSDLGCVYVLEDLGPLARQFKHKQDLTVKRINIPYEEFFICPHKYRSIEFRGNSSRCNTTIADLDKSGLLSMDTLVKVGIALVVLLNVAFLYFLCYVRQYYKKITFFNSESESSKSNKTESKSKKAGSPLDNVGSVYKNAESPSKKAGSVSKKAGPLSKKAGSVSKKATSPSKKAGSVSKKATSPTGSLYSSLISASKRSLKPTMTSTSSPTISSMGL